MKVFKAFSARLANYLVKSGYQVLYTEPNLKNIGLDVWCFEDTEDLRKAYSSYCANKD